MCEKGGLAAMQITKETLEKIKLASEIATAWIGVLALIGGGGFAIQQYIDKKHDDRVKETLNFLDRYYDDPFLSARAELSKAWDAHAHEEDELLGSPSSTNEAIHKFFVKVVHDEHIEGASSMVVDFYGALDSCVMEKICDRATARRFFQDDAKVYYHRGYAYIMEQRKDRNIHLFGSGMENFAKLK